MENPFFYKLAQTQYQRQKSSYSTDQEYQYYLYTRYLFISLYWYIRKYHLHIRVTFLEYHFFRRNTIYISVNLLHLFIMIIIYFFLTAFCVPNPTQAVLVHVVREFYRNSLLECDLGKFIIFDRRRTTLCKVRKRVTMFCDKSFNTTNLRIWIKLTDSAGNPYDNVHPTRVTILSNADLDDIRDAVKAKFANKLSSVDSAELCLYQNQPALDANIQLDDGCKFSDLSLGRSMNDALIVVVPSLPVAVPLNQQTSLSFMISDESCPILSFPKDDVLVKIPWSYIKDSGLIRKEKAVLVLYRRPAFEEQWHEMTTYVIKHNVVLWLLGPPGTGKSCAAFAFACSLDRSEWNIVWIHYSKEEADFNCVKFDGNQKLTCTVPRDYSYQIISLLTSTKKTFVILYLF
jgi:hypothetical protein